MSEKKNTPISGKFGERMQKIADAVKNFPRRTKAAPTPIRKDTYTLEELIAVGRRKRKTRGDTERLSKEQKIQKRAEILYRLDPLVFAGVNRLKRLVATPKIYWTGGSEEDRAAMEKWSKQVRLKKIIQEGTQDVIVYGYSTIEKIKDNSGLPVKLITVDPKTMDWEKDGTKLKVDEYGEPIGYIQEPEQGESDIHLKRDEIVLLRLFTLGRECLGISPLEPAFKAAWIRLNLEEAYGEAIFRHGYPLYYFKVGDKDHPITVELIRNAKKILKDFDTAEELILPDWIEPGRLDPKSEIRAVIELWTFLAGEVARALDSPISLILPTGAGESKGTTEFSGIDLEKAVKDYQEILKDQLDEQLFDEVRNKLNLKTSPELQFSESSPRTQLLRMRMISMLSARGALHIDSKTENAIRQELGLPLLPIETDDQTEIGINEEVNLECLGKETSKTSLVKKKQRRKKK